MDKTEVLIAKKKAKPITVVMPPGITSVTKLMLEAASEFVGWSAVSIVTAIRKWAGNSG